MRAFLLLVAVATSLLLASPRLASACSCMQSSQEEAFESSSAVFEGRVLTVTQGPDASGVRVRMRVVRAWKGVDSEEIEVTTPSDSAACGYNFTADASYLVYARRPEDVHDLAAVSLCSRTAPIDSESALADVSAMGAGVTPVDIVDEPADQTRPTPPRTAPGAGGCAGCAVHNDEERAPLGLALFALAVLAFGARRRRRP